MHDREIGISFYVETELFIPGFLNIYKKQHNELDHSDHSRVF